MKTLIVDDERPARDELRRLLEAHPEIHVIAEAADAAGARTMIERHNPELMFLDVHMPQESGFDLLSGLGTDAPRIILTTAHDQYALDAFDFAAVDYLLKPIAPDRLARAVARILVPAPPVLQKKTSSDSLLKLSDQFLVTQDGRSTFLNVSSILGAEAAGPYTTLWTERGTPMIRRSLASFFERLPKDTFFQANRAEIINCTAIEKAERWFSGSYLVTLKGGRKVELSRRQAKEFKDRFSL